MKVALVHDDLVQWGGAERVLVALAEIFPDAPIYTSIFDTRNEILKQKFASKQIITSFLQNIPGWKNLYRALLPLYPLAFEQFDFSQFDLVISQTTRFAKSIITKPDTKHICYCHTPPRFLWNFSGEKVSKLLQPYLSLLRLYDQISSNRVDVWVAGSKNAQERIGKIYQKNSKVIYPFIDLKRFSGIESFDGGYLLVISRLNQYKRVDLAIQAAEKLNKPLKIIGVGPELYNLQMLTGKANGIQSEVEFLGKVGEDVLLKVLAGCSALVIAGEEDFGLTSLEAQILGKPVIAYKKGGVLETVIDGETGFLFDKQDSDSLIEALQKLDKKGYNLKSCIAQASRFSKEKFTKDFKDIISSL